MPDAPITCRELTEFLDDYLADRLESAVRAAFDEHLAVCSDCANYLSSYRRSIELGKQANGNSEKAPPIPPELTKAILKSRRPT